MRPHIVDFLTGFLGHDTARLLAPRYFTMVAIAALLASWLMLRAARRAGLDRLALLDALLIGYLGCVIGGIVFPILVDAGGQLLDGRVPRLRWAGMVAYGGFLGGFLGAVWGLSRRRTLSMAQFGDLLAAPLGLAVAVVRIGCFIGGCDYGKVTSMPWGVRFPAGSPGWHDHVDAGWVPAWRGESLPVHPTQLYESLLGVAIFIGITIWARRRRQDTAAPGGLFMAALGAYAIGRFGIETLRGDASRGFVGLLSTSQVIGVLVLLAVAVTAFRRRRAVPAVLALLLSIHGASAQAQAQPQPQPQPEPLDPYAQPAPQPAPQPPPPARPYVPPPPYGGNVPPPDTPAAPAGPTIVRPFPVTRYEVGLLVASTTAISRPERQVPSLWGPGVVATIGLKPYLRVGGEIEGTTSKLSTHRSLLGMVSFRMGTTRSIAFKSQFAVGVTMIDFVDPSFDDVYAFDVRLAAGAEMAVGDWVKIIVQPLAVDVMSSKDLGVPLWSWQLRAGVSFGWGE